MKIPLITAIWFVGQDGWERVVIGKTGQKIEKKLESKQKRKL